MHDLSVALTNKLLENNFIAEDRAQWCRYAIERRITSLFSLLCLILYGTFLGSFPVVVCFVLTAMFLRARTNGYHAKTYLGCLIVSVIAETICILVVPYISLVGASILLCLSSLVIIILAPCNHKNIHMSDNEMQGNRKAARIRLAVVLLAEILLITAQNTSAYVSTATAVAFVAIALAFAYLKTEE